MHKSLKPNKDYKYRNITMNVDDFVNQLKAFTNTLNNDNNKQPSSNIVVETPITPVTPIIPSNNSKKIKLLIVSTHVNQVNGYSKVMLNVIQQLSAQPWLNIVHFGTQKMTNSDIGRKYPSGVKIIDGSAMEKQKAVGFAFSELPGVILSEKPDIVFIYNDIAVISGYIEEIRKVIQNRFFKIWAYIDTTYKSPPQQMIDIINRDVDRIFCFTKSWKDEIKSHGITRSVDVMNHGVDPKMFRSIPKEVARQSLGLPTDIFIFSSLNRNIPRKRLDLLVMSFVKLIVRFPTKPLFLLIVADKGDKGGYQLFEIFARELKLAGASTDVLGNRLLITSTNTFYSDDDINLLYNCADVGISCAEGEGFGLCSFEQMYVGVPQIVPNINGYSEYCDINNSIMIKPKMRYYIPQAHNTVTGEAQIVDVEDVSKAMERYVFDEDLRKLHGKLGKEKISEYTWEKCCSTLIKRLRTQLDDDDEN
jgi:glycosyltransferase involved in cell wall biosynthesis